ncbi:MAG TPA: hypothetical protein VGN08_05265 [Solirubrobacteraceae bacterium]
MSIRRALIPSCLAAAALSAGLAACGSAATQRITAVSSATRARWTPAVRITRVLDLTPPRGDGAIVLATAGRLALLGAGGAVHPFARGAGGYRNPGGEEPYIALSSGERVSSGGCSFPAGTVYVLRLRHGSGVTAVDPGGRARELASLPARGLENGIALDTTGRFGHRLLVTATEGARTTVYAIDCRGTVTTLSTAAPKLEGGIAVAPASFGRFAGDLIAPDENSGRVYAISPDGRSSLVAGSGLARGGDVGVESAGFVPAGFGSSWSALVADRRTPGNPHPGDDAVLRIGGSSLIAAGVAPGQLLVATEGGAQTDAIACTAAGCRIRHVADGPAAAHLEGHIVFASGR